MPSAMPSTAAPPIRPPPRPPHRSRRPGPRLPGCRSSRTSPARIARPSMSRTGA
ncbi:hypothetical protein ACFFX0_23440 [Citricoccus parietis]|uniref:Uncharacterized protein n=1 Tax=Citricoccus parietis TaxID=592307 RepID=A0ABV5G4X0_9MICC